LGLSIPLAQRAFGAAESKNSFLGVFSTLLQDHSHVGDTKAPPISTEGTLPKKKASLPGADTPVDTKLNAQSIAAVQVATIQLVKPSPANAANGAEHAAPATGRADGPVAPIGQKPSEPQQSGPRGFVPSASPVSSAAKSPIVNQNVAIPHEQGPATQTKDRVSEQSPLAPPEPLAFPSARAAPASTRGLENPKPDSIELGTSRVDSFQPNTEYPDATKPRTELTSTPESNAKLGESAESPKAPENLKQDVAVKLAVGDPAPARLQPLASNPSKFGPPAQPPETGGIEEATAQVGGYAKSLSSVLSPLDRVKVAVYAPKTNLEEDAEPNIVKGLKDDSSHRSAVRSTDAPLANGVKETGQVNQPSILQAREHEPVFEQIAAKIIANSSVKGPDRETELHVRLSPPELGGVQVHLTATSQGVSARLVVDQEMTKQLLENHAGTLKQRLSESGIQLGSFQVSRHPWSNGGDRQKGNDKSPDLSDPADGLDPVRPAAQARPVTASKARMGSINVLA
jgi:flagellar hook-length control protein FliK